MTSEQLIAHILDGLKDFGSALAPAAIGSAVAQAWEKGLSLGERFVQWVVGICVSYYVTLLVGSMFAFNDFAAQGIGFVVAMIAFKATPKFIASASDSIAGLPGAIRDRFFPRKDGK